MEHLISFSADLDLPDQHNRTPLHSSCKCGHTAIAVLLLNAKAQIDVPDIKGWTALHIACQQGHEELVHILVQSGADPTRTENEGKTPLDLTLDLEKPIIEAILMKKNVTVVPSPEKAVATVAMEDSGSSSSDTEKGEGEEDVLQADRPQTTGSSMAAWALGALTKVIHSFLVSLSRTRGPI